MSNINQEGNFNFRCSGPRYHVHVDLVYAMVNAPIEHTYNLSSTRNLRPHDFHTPAFWNSIMGLESYDPSSSLMSIIIHPILKLTLRIICNTIFPQYKTTKAVIAKLKIIWCMITMEALLHLGYLLFPKLIKVSCLRKGRIICGSLVFSSLYTPLTTCVASMHS